jgi:hypothetical protein
MHFSAHISSDWVPSAMVSGWFHMCSAAAKIRWSSMGLLSTLVLYNKPPSSGHPDDRGSKHLWNISKLLPDFTAQHPRTSSQECFLMHSHLAILLFQIEQLTLKKKTSHPYLHNCSTLDWGTFDSFNWNWSKEHSLQVWQKAPSIPCICTRSISKIKMSNPVTEGFVVTIGMQIYLEHVLRNWKRKCQGILRIPI